MEITPSMFNFSLGVCISDNGHLVFPVMVEERSGSVVESKGRHMHTMLIEFFSC